ncbi:unnamed protein product [Rhizopus microsporus]
MPDQHKKEIMNEPLRKSKRLRKESIDDENELSPKLQKLDQQVQDTLTHSNLKMTRMNISSNSAIKQNDLEGTESLPDLDHSDIDELTDSINYQMAIESNENEEQPTPLKEELIIDQQQIDTTSVDQEDVQSIIDIMERTSSNENDGETESDDYFGSEDGTDTQSIRHETENEEILAPDTLKTSDREILSLSAGQQEVRNENLNASGIFFTQEAYEAYTISYNLVPELHGLLQSAILSRREFECSNEEANDPSPSEHVFTPGENISSEPEDQSEPEPVLQTPNLLDTVLNNLEQYQSDSNNTQQGVSDLEIAAQFADLNDNTDTKETKDNQYSKLTRQQHKQFISLSDQIKKGTPLSDPERFLYNSLCIAFKAEQEEYVNHQRKRMLASKVYDILDNKVDTMIKEYYALENKRIQKYPRFYRCFNFVKMPVAIPQEKPILSFKKSLLKSGQICACKPEVFESPRRMDIFKHYIDTGKAYEDDIAYGTYYKKKMPPNLSDDRIVHDIIKHTRFEVVISSSSLLKLVEIQNDLSTSTYIPLTVKQENDYKTLIFDRPLPKEALTKREMNKIVYDLAFKSLCLDWAKRHPISSTSKPNINSSDTEEWDYNNDENLQYNHWTFGEDLNILIRHQSDGELSNQNTTGTADKKVILVSKLDYQICEEREEVVTPAERAMNWLRSYIGGHSIVMEGRIDLVNNRLVRVDKKQMIDIMGDRWQPIGESELIRQTFLNLQKILEPGQYLLHHKPGDRNFLIYQSIDEQVNQNDSSIIDLHKKYGDNSPYPSDSANCFIPAWKSNEEQVAWTFPLK